MPAGLGARDTLRLEAALPLYGHELDDDTTPLEAGLARFVELERDFIGAAAIRARGATRAFARTLVGFELDRARASRAPGYPVLAAGERVGHVTSGGPSPTLENRIGLAYVPTALSRTRHRARDRSARARDPRARRRDPLRLAAARAGRPNA